MAETIQGTDTPRKTTVPSRPGLEGLEEKFTQRWAEEKTYAFDPATQRDQVYSIDTPPPTASGSLHVGHMFSYTQTDVLARYQRMRGKNVFYPLGWDDNGLPTERRVQNYYGVLCDPAVPYEADFTPPEKPAKNQRDWPRISRQNFIELCEVLALEDEKVFADLFTRLGLSVDWSLTYRTIDHNSRRVSQLAFLADLASGAAYMAEAPTMWDVTYRTAVAQAELEDREREGAYHRICFYRPDGERVWIETTRPELLPSCVALVAHPDDERYRHLVGSKVRSPLFGVEVPVLAHPLAQPDKGAGIAMVCTFGDTTDVTWWRELELDTRALIDRQGRFSRELPAWISSPEGISTYKKIAGATVFTAQKTIVELLSASGELDGQPKKITHPVKFYEKGDKPLEIVASRQWYIRNGGRDAHRRQKLLERGRQITWHPSFMQSRYDNWVEGLNGDWLISRQRFFGVPFPLWYRLDEQGNPDYDNPIIPKPEDLPVDPASQSAPGYRPEQRGQAAGFIADPDVLDTWATSSLTPQIATGWARDEALHRVTFPMDLRPQGHDIIRTWLFSTVVRSNSLADSIPWSHTALSGWILDPDRKKMSKSKGNVVVPRDVLEKYGSDAVRYWASSARLGADTAYDEAQMKIGRRLAIKLLNASKFVLNLGVSESSIPRSEEQLALVSNPLDLSLLANLAQVVTEAGASFEKYDYARALQLSENFFWTFTDDYVELIKDRAYGSEGKQQQDSVLTTLASTLDTLLRLFAPFLPFVTDEVWSWWRAGSVHRASWPDGQQYQLPSQAGDLQLLSTLGLALGGLRKAKSVAQVKQRTQVLEATICADEPSIARLKAGLADLKAAGNAAELKLVLGQGELEVSDVVLEAEPAS